MFFLGPLFVCDFQKSDDGGVSTLPDLFNPLICAAVFAVISCFSIAPGISQNLKMTIKKMVTETSQLINRYHELFFLDVSSRGISQKCQGNTFTCHWTCITVTQ